jgi:hypothetical protein
MKRAVGLLVLLVLHIELLAQVDTTFIYNTSMPYGTLDIRLRKSATRYYYLQEGQTFSYRESSPGVKTNTYRDMTSWDSNSYGQGHLREKNGNSDYFIMNYRLLPPKNYNPNYAAGYPLILFLHGAGERGNCWRQGCHWASTAWSPNTNDPPAPTDADSKLLNNDHNLLHGGGVLLSMRNAANGKLPNDPTLPSRSYPGFVLFPQNLNGWNGTNVQDAIRLVRLIAKKYNIDENRIYIMGLSQGGPGVYEAIKRAPWLFASAQTMSAVSDASASTSTTVSRLITIPIWTFQGGKDGDPSPGETERFVKRFRDAGLTVRYTLYPPLHHGTWNQAMAEPDYFTWMLKNSKTNIKTFGDFTSICESNGQGVRMHLAEGFRAYQWERNGVIIAGATGAAYVATTPGTYRARFSRVPNPTEGQWNQWSPPVNVTEGAPNKPVVSQVGTVVLKGLDGFADARLVAPKGFAKYTWYKNGVKLSFADTVSRPTIKATSGNGAYTVTVAGYDGCPSPASDPKHIYFNDSAPVNITAPTNFNGTMADAATVRLTWSDASSNESGFEIWRRRVLSTTTFEPWQMRAITNANSTSYNDGDLQPSSTYHFKIRAVGAGGRSNYTPSAADQYLVISSGSDTQAPTAPQNLVAKATAINTIKLTWSASNDNTGIKQYRIYYGTKSIATNSDETTYTVSGLTLNTVYNFTVKAEDHGGNLSAASNSATANTYVNGLYWEHSTGSWTDLDEINWTEPAEYTGTSTTFTLSPRTQEDFFFFEFDGYLYINTAGTYYFQTISSDGSRLTLDGSVLVDNDGIHASRTSSSAPISLTAGPKRINVKYFEAEESHVLTVRYKGPDTGNSYVSIPASALKSGNPPATMMSTEEAIIVDEPTVVNIYPNPTNDNDINVRMESTESNEPVLIRVIDFTGRQVYQAEFAAEEVNQGIRVLPSERLQDGIYLLQLNHRGKIVQERISIKN